MVWTNLIIPFATSYVIVLIMVPLVRKYALQWKLGDKPNGRKIHASSIPHLGGVGLTCGIVGSLVLFGMMSRGFSLMELARMAPGVSLIIILGLLDDLKSLKALHKLSIQIVAVLILVSSGFELLLGFPHFDTSPLLVALLTIFFLIGVSNSINLIDGHDGLAAGICFISSAAFAVLSVLAGAEGALVISLAVGGACLAFLIFNFPPGKIFMGDTGSMFLGIVLGLVSCSIATAEASFYTLIAVCFILGVPMIDTCLAIARRMSLRVPIFKADCLHIHHILSSFGLTERQTLFVLYSIQTVLAVLGIFVMQGFFFSIIVGLTILLLLFTFFLRLMLVSRQVEKELTATVAHDTFPALDKIAK